MPVYQRSRNVADGTVVEWYELDQWGNPAVVDGYRLAQGGECHVAPWGNDTNNGLSPGQAKATLVAAVATGLPVRVAAGTYEVATTSLDTTVPIRGAGVGVTILTVPDGETGHAVIRVAGTDVVISDLTIIGTGTAADLANFAGAVQLNGATRPIVERVRVEGVHTGFSTFQSAQVTFRDCTVVGAFQYGFDLNDVDVALIDNCHADACRLDGFKLRRATRNVTIRGGSSNNSTAGDGLDAYAGGDTFVIDALSCEGNGVNGITIKSDALNRDDSATYGFVRSVTVTGARCSGNTGYGLTVHRAGTTDDPTIPLVSGATIVGGVYQENGLSGVYLNARNVTVLGGVSRANGRHGYEILATAMDVDLIGVTAIGNGRNVGDWDGISAAGSWVSVQGGRSIGSDADGVIVDGDYPAGTQRAGVHITGDGVTVTGLVSRHNQSD